MPTLRNFPGMKEKGGNNGNRTEAQQIKRTNIRNHFVAACGEFVGTFLFLFFAFLGHSMAATTEPNFSGIGGGPSNSQVIYVSLAYGLSLLVTAWTLYRVSGGLFNPAVTLGMVVSGSLPAMRGLVLFPVQIVSAICAAAVASAIIPGDISIVETTLAPGMSSAQGVFLEMFLTAQLVFTIHVLAAEKSKDTYLAPIGIGLALFVCEIAGVYYTGASLNPARSFGPCVVAANFQTYHWIYWIGPSMGALLAAGFYRFLLYMNEGDLGAANPGQDSAAGDFDAEREEKRANSDLERQAESQLGHTQSGYQGSPIASGAGGGQQAQPGAYKQSNQSGGWGANVMSEMDQRSADVSHRRPVGS